MSWSSNIQVIAQLVGHRNDLLEIRNDQLHLTKGTRTRSATTALTLQPVQMAFHLDQLIGLYCQNRFNELKNSQSYEEVTCFRKEVKILKQKISDLSFSLRSKQDKKRYSELYQQADAFYQESCTLKKSLPKPNQRPVVHLQYDEWMTCKFKHPKRVPLQETVAAAKEALERSNLKVSKGKRIAIIAAKIALLAIPLMITSFIHPIKEFIWNPIEQKIRGGVRTESPFDRLIQIAWPDNHHERNFIALSRQILLRPVIGQEEVDAILPFLPYMKTVDLWNAHLKDEDSELEKMNYLQQITKENLMTILEESAKSPSCKTIKISREFRKLPEIKQWLADHGFKQVRQSDQFTSAL